METGRNGRPSGWLGDRMAQESGINQLWLSNESDATKVKAATKSKGKNNALEC